MRTPIAHILRGLCVLSFAYVAVACDRGTSTTAPAVGDPRIKPLPTVDVVIAGRQFKLEVADDFAERETGLMYRTSMPADHGMLFVFDKPVDDPFWMKNTNIPLDIAYVGSDDAVKTIAQMYPHDLTPVGSNGTYKYAIELNQGIAKQIGLKEGDRIAIPKLTSPPTTTSPTTSPTK